MKRRLAAAAVLAVTAAALAGCEPWFVPTDPTKASISISIGSAGGADARLIVGGRTQTHAELARIGQSVATALFPRSPHRSVGVGDNGGGNLLVHIHASDVYEPAAHPVLTIDTGPAIGVLNSLGVTSVNISIGGPGVPTAAQWRGPPPADTYRDEWSWEDVAPHGPAPAGSIALNPRPARGIIDLSLAILCLACLYPAIVGVRRRRRLLGGAAAVVASVALLVDVLSAGAVQPNNLGVAGLVNGLELNVVKVVTILPLLVAPAVVCLFIVTAVRRESLNNAAGSFNPPPGWPPPPAGWWPAPGWQPDPSWPAPPPDWVFWPQPPSNSDRVQLNAAHKSD